MNNFYEKIGITKKIADRLIPNTFPRCKLGDDSEISMLKTTEILIDGYDCGIFHSISDFDNYKIKILQIWPIHHYFISFNVMAKIVSSFLGKKGLYFFEIWNNEKMLYCWTLVLDKNNSEVSNFYKLKQKQCTFQDLTYNVINPREINII